MPYSNSQLFTFPPPAWPTSPFSVAVNCLISLAAVAVTSGTTTSGPNASTTPLVEGAGVDLTARAAHRQPHG